MTAAWNQRVALAVRLMERMKAAHPTVAGAVPLQERFQWLWEQCIDAQMLNMELRGGAQGGGQDEGHT